MMAKNIPKMPLPKLDDLFTTEEERTNDKLEKVIDIKISDIDDFQDHPFKVIENEDMYNMRDSIKENGVLVPALGQMVEMKWYLDTEESMQVN